jgi:hypothetical protein
VTAEGRALTGRSWRGIGLGALVALALPLAYLLLAFLVQSGAVDPDRMGGFKEGVTSLTFNVFAEIILLAIGLATAGRAARLSSPWAWLLLYVVSIPLVGFVWFVCYATLGGALGSPF